MVTIVDVARHAGVSTATVSRVVNNPKIVDDETRRAVDAVIQNLGYRPNAIAQGLVSRSSKTIGVVINCFATSYYGRMLDGVEKALSALGYKAIAESSHESAEGERSAITSLLDRQCEGIVLHSDKLDDDEVAALAAKHPKIVFMNRLLQGFEERSVYLDNVQGGKLAAAYLAEAGHRQIAVVTGPMSYFECQDRLDGFINEMITRGREFDDTLMFEGDFTSASGRLAMENIIATARRVTAVFFMNDEMAAGAIDYCLAQGIHVPFDVSILGFDDLEVAKFLHPKLTTIRQPLGDIGAAAGTLAHAIATKQDHSACRRRFEAEVMERASVKKNYDDNDR